MTALLTRTSTSDRRQLQVWMIVQIDASGRLWGRSRQQAHMPLEAVSHIVIL